MKKDEVCNLIRQIGIIPAIRVSSSEDAHFAVSAVANGGIPIVEITMTIPGAIEVISHIARHDSKIVVGAGTVLDTETAQRCLDAGAQFLTATGFDVTLVEFAAKHDVTVFPGALTPTEIISAWKAGSDFVKVFPCVHVGGDKYIKAVNTALPQIPLIAAGGVNQQTATNFILAGATAIGVGNELVPSDAIECRESARIRELARRFTGFVKEARDRLPPTKEGEAVATINFSRFHRR